MHRLLLAILPLVGSVVPVWGAVIGGPFIGEGIEIVPSTEPQEQLDRRIISATDSIFLVADVHAGKDNRYGFAEHAFIPYLSISYSLSKDGAPAYRKTGLLFPVASKSGPQYVGSTEMAGPGAYHLTYIVSPPSSHGMMRQTGKDRGVPEWWKPITASWNFTYPGSNTLSAK